MRRRLCLIVLSLIVNSFADTITFEGKHYEDVYVSKTKSSYIICFPDTGQTKRVDITEV